MIPVKVMSDEDGHWYIIPNDKAKQFLKDLSGPRKIADEDFDEIYGKYRTGGDINLVQLYA